MSLSAAGPLGPMEAVDRVLVNAAVALVVLSLVYGMSLLLASRRGPRLRATPAWPEPDLFFVFLLPCLDEERVIANSVRRLLAVPGDNYVVMVIDDASTDRTAAVVEEIGDSRVWLYRRTLPDARQGKGEALNAAVRYLVGGPLQGADPRRTVVVIVDADGRLEPHAVAEVTPYFTDPRVGAVQIGVRINNRFDSRLARMQDMEFVIYTEVFQRGRRHLNSVGLGGNGQFMRLSALQSLGDSPWSRSLTEDLDMGVRLLATGWRNEYCHTAAVHQQGVPEVRRLVRQRSRWFQGHLMSSRLVLKVMREVRGVAALDLVYHLTGPVLLLTASCLTGSFVLSALASIVYAVTGSHPDWTWLLVTYALSFGPALAYSVVYWRRERAEGPGLLRCCGWAHAYVVYGLMWYVAGWWAVARIIKGQHGWAKTERTVEAEEPPVPQRAGGH
ncbi:glycosyltransferase family 2 protein [Geodermatophilus sp. SYSU D01062]